MSKPRSTDRAGARQRSRRRPLLSIVVLTRNRRELLRSCLESLFVQENNERSFEILVVDDGSSDGTRDLVRSLALSHPVLAYLPQPHRGIAAARNSGIRRARGEIIAFVADDYVLAPDYVRTILRFFREHPEAQAVRFKIAAAADDLMSRISHAYHEASVKRRLAQGESFPGHRSLWRLPRAKEKLTVHHGLEAAGGAAFRREVFRRVGLFDESFVRVEDTDFTMRMRAKGIPVFYVPFHEIRHHYGPSLRAALKSSFLTGRCRYRFYAKNKQGPMNIPSLVGQGLAMKASALYWALWRARQTGSIFRFFLYLPFMLLLELSTKAGFFLEGVRPTKGRPGRGRTPPTWAVKSLLFQVPSGSLYRTRRERRRVKLMAITMVRNEARFLPGMLRNVGPQVDGIVALDDGSTDGSDRLLERSRYVAELLRNPAGRPGYDEMGGYRRLLKAALRHGADWVIVVDADERLEREFRMRAERVIRRGRGIGLKAFEVHIRELWDSKERYRADGVWGRKAAPRLFRVLPDHSLDERPLHAAKAPLQGKIFGAFPLADLFVYHLRMVRHEDREARRRRYEQLDPEANWQPHIGYAYLTNERGMELQPVPKRRGYDE